MTKDPVDALLGPAKGPGDDEEEDEESPETDDMAPAAPAAEPVEVPEAPKMPERPPEEVIDEIQASLDELRGKFAQL